MLNISLLSIGKRDDSEDDSISSDSVDPNLFFGQRHGRILEQKHNATSRECAAAERKDAKNLVKDEVPMFLEKRASVVATLVEDDSDDEDAAERKDAESLVKDQVPMFLEGRVAHALQMSRERARAAAERAAAERAAAEAEQQRAAIAQLSRRDDDDESGPPPLLLQGSAAADAEQSISSSSFTVGLLGSAAAHSQGGFVFFLPFCPNCETKYLPSF